MLPLESRNRLTDVGDFSEYRDDPSGFARDILNVDYLWDKQEEAQRLLLVPPYRVQAPAGNEVGKTFIGAATLLWWFCTRSPCIIITTAPTAVQVKNLLWKEARRLARRAGLNLPFLPKDSQLYRAADDFAIGKTATGYSSFQGDHGPDMLFIIDEATGVDAAFYEAIDSMFNPAIGHAILFLYNPTDTTSHIYQEYRRATGRQGKTSHIVRMSALEHPNVLAELRGEPPPVPHALRLAAVERRLLKWCQLVSGEPKATDIQWPPPWAEEYIARTGMKPRWFRPGPIAEARILGRFPSQSTYSVWGEGDWQVAVRANLDPLPIPLWVLPEIGIDVARFGDDNTAFHVRCGPCSLYHWEFNGQDTTVTIGTAKRLAREWAKWACDRRPEHVSEFDIPIKVDDSGVGGGVTDHLREAEYLVAGINAGTKAISTEDYRLRRDELWFEVAERARRNELDLSRLDAETLEKLEAEAMSPEYKVDSGGRRVVEAKDETKSKLSASPDGMDAVNLAYAYADGLEPSEAPEVGMRMRR